MANNSEMSGNGVMDWHSTWLEFLREEKRVRVNLQETVGERDKLSIAEHESRIQDAEKIMREAAHRALIAIGRMRDDDLLEHCRRDITKSGQLMSRFVWDHLNVSAEFDLIRPVAASSIPDSADTITTHTEAREGTYLKYFVNLNGIADKCQATQDERIGMTYSDTSGNTQKPRVSHSQAVETILGFLPHHSAERSAAGSYGQGLFPSSKLHAQGQAFLAPNPALR